MSRNHQFPRPGGGMAAMPALYGVRADGSKPAPHLANRPTDRHEAETILGNWTHENQLAFA